MNGLFHNAASHGDSRRMRIARAFSRGAASYDDHAELQREVADSLLDQLPNLAGSSTLLDLGCGTGYCTRRLQQKFPDANIVALDLAEPMLQKTLGRCSERMQLLCADAVALPLRSACIDFILSSLTVQWCDDVTVLFAELQRVLRPGGSALISTLGPDTLRELRTAWQQVDARQHSNRFFSQDEILSAVTASGLQCELGVEMRVRHCQSLRALAYELKGLGANTVAMSQPATGASPTAFKMASAIFEKQREAPGIPVSWEIFYLRLHKPD